MTALKKYVRLESGGLWKANPDAQRRDVTVSFGDATLVIADPAGRPLSHWSLPAIERQNPDEMPAIFAPDEAASETLEINEDTMVEAIEEIRKALAKSRPKPGKLRHLTTITIMALILGLAIFWLPGALTRQTLAVVPFSKRVEIGKTMLGHVQRDTGLACAEPSANEAGGQLMTRLFGDGSGNQLAVLPKLDQGSALLPGGIILLDRSLLESANDPAVAAGYILKASSKTDPLADILRDAGLRVTFQLLTTGEIPPEVLQHAAQGITSGTENPFASDLLAPSFASAQVPPEPYIATAERRGVDMDIPEETNADDYPAILNDSAWVSLQNICNI